ncbi:MAG: LPS export ABC transporter periplasmic protein LptC [Candidatus Schekmanbacteria bacterium]|nr:MAG: LPS export ABC transporter periplasmic protein LptC [Candidatus Schekmanbacteria bacterium]
MPKKILYKIRYPLLTIFVIVLAGILLNLYLSGNKSDEDSIANKEVEKMAEEVPTVSIKPLNFSQASTGASKFALTAQRADFFQDKGKGILTKFKLVYTYEKGKKVIVSGDEAVVTADVNSDLTMGLGDANIICTKPVKAIFTNGMNFVSEDLQWNGMDGDITAKGKVKLFGNDFRIEGYGLRANLKEEKIELLSKVKLMVVPSTVNKMTKDGFI